MEAPKYKQIMEGRALPSPTGVALEILRLTSDKHATIDAIAAAVQSDPALAGRMLKLVNSPFAGLSRRIASVPAAVRLLGMRTVKNLALGLSLISNSRNGRCEGFDYEGFWSHSLARAVAAWQLVHRMKGFAPDEAFTTGLLGGIGRLALATAFPREYTDVLNAVSPDDIRRMRTAERAAFGIDHNELSAQLMAEWYLQDIFCEAVRQQDATSSTSTQDDSRTSRLARILHLAGSVASVLVQPQPAGDALRTLLSEAEEVGVPPTTLEELFDAAASEWRDAGTIFSVTTRGVPSLQELVAKAAPVAHGGEPRAAERTGEEAASRQKDPLRVLIVDDDPAALRLLNAHLTAAGYKVMTAANGCEALATDRLEAPQVIITDWNMPEMDGVELCRRLREHEGLGFVYVIMLTASAERDRVVEALEAGADDFLTKPYSKQELMARVRSGERIVRLEASLVDRSREVSHYNAGLSAANEKLRIMATTDELTGLANRREAMARLGEHWSRVARSGEPLSCIIADIDHFKNFNDKHGHGVGDAVLKATAYTLKRAARAGEVACRIGGEEFMVICPGATQADAIVAAERMRAAVAANVVKANGAELSLTISAGVAERTQSMGHPDELLKAADDSLYAAKEAGRNRVCAAGQAVEHSAQEASREEPQPISTPPPAGDLGGLPVRVLLVDDDPGTRALVRRTLEHDGSVVAEAADGAEALERVRACSPDVIVMDAHMPQVDGMECTRRLKANPTTQDIPVIMLSAASEAESVEGGLESGADEYITKPIRDREFVLRVRSMARLYRSKAELLWSNQIRWEQARTLQVLFDLSCNLVGAESLDFVIEQTLAAATELTCSRRVSIMLPDGSGEYLIIAGAMGLKENLVASLRVPIGAAIAGEVFQSGIPVIVNAPGEDEPRLGRHDSDFFVSAPLISNALRAADQVVGVLNITDRHAQRPFSQGEVESIELLCNVVGTAIDDLTSRRARDQAHESVVIALATLAEYRDVDTGSHLDRVTPYALLLAKNLRNEEPFRQEIDDVFLSSLERAMPLHDIGKVTTPDRILLKPGKLDAAEMETMRLHAAMGASAIRSIINRGHSAPFLEMAHQIALGHHEWYDGGGYPRRLTGDAIPLAARIAAVADVYDALRSKRPYKEPMSAEKAGELIRAGLGTQFDPAVVKAFIRCEAEFTRVAAELADEPQTADGPAARELACSAVEN